MLKLDQPNTKITTTIDVIEQDAGVAARKVIEELFSNAKFDELDVILKKSIDYSNKLVVDMKNFNKINLRRELDIISNINSRNI